MKTHSSLLKNGLQVILVPSHKAPVVSVQCWVRTGSAEESKGNEGISHFIEHLVFKGSKDFGPGEIANIVEAGGGELNAYTSFDQTVFYVTISASQSNTALQVVSQMMGFPLFDPREIDAEREVVVEEIKRGQDSFSRRGSELLFSTHYKGHPYGRPVIGYEKNIRKWSSEHIRNYYKKRYSPKNMFLLITGDFEIQNMKREVTRFFTPIPTQKIPRIPKIPWSPKKKPQQKIQGTGFQQRLVYLVWPGPRVQHKDVPGLDVLMMILGQGDSSRLVRHLRLEKPLVQSVGASCYSPLEPGLLMISLVPLPELLAEALQQLQHEILKIRHEPISLPELQKAVRALETDDLMSQESVEGLARKFGSLEFYLRDLKAQDKYQKALRELTPLQLQKLAQKYLDPHQMSRIALVPESETKFTRHALSHFSRSLLKADQNVGTERALSQKPRWDRIVRTQLSSHPNEVQSLLINGVRVFLKKTSESSLVSVRASFLGGSRLDKLPELGRTEVLGRTWLGGTSKRNEHEIAEISENYASSLYPVVGRNTIGLALDVLSSHEKKISDLFFDCLFHP
ncbi:MAG: insulinase family protein, partial [Bdellovibrio sp.]